MNYISSLQNQVASLKSQLNQANTEIQEFIQFLHSPKFIGVDSNGDRKDWISTGDVIARLRELRQVTLT